MKSVRLAVALAVGATALIGGVSSAAPVKACNLLKDDKGDATQVAFEETEGLAPNNPQLDILTADIASDAKAVTAVIRTDQLAPTDSNAPGGRAYYANFYVGEKGLYLAARIDSAGTATYSAGYLQTTRQSLGAATGVFDPAKKEIRITAPLSQFAPQASLKPGTKITDLNALAQRLGVVLTLTADVAEGGVAYTAGAPSCVAVGK